MSDEHNVPSPVIPGLRTESTGAEPYGSMSLSLYPSAYTSNSVSYVVPTLRLLAEPPRQFASVALLTVQRNNMGKRAHCAPGVLPRRAREARKPFLGRDGRFVKTLRGEHAGRIGGGHDVRGYGREEGITAEVPGEIA